MPSTSSRPAPLLYCVYDRRNELVDCLQVGGEARRLKDKIGGKVRKERRPDLAA